MATVRVRKDIWDLGDEANPWRDPAILAYARAVAAMQKVDKTAPKNGASWKNQAAIHERRAASVPGRLENQCQHSSWYFLPWHRMYLYRFEQIVRSHMPAAMAAKWALPYWNYTQVAARRALPPAFREKKLPDGKTNPLYVAQRSTSFPDINAGEPLPSTGVTTAAALAEGVFTRSVPGATAGFGGSKTGFSHSGGGIAGPLEQTPHGDVHVLVGGSGFMSSFGTAALDPIFWLHHCNLDRLWERWLRAPAGGHPPGKNPTDPAWLNRKFELVNRNGNRVKLAVKDILDIEGQLNYTYSGLPAAQDLDELMEIGDVSDDERPAELVGATEKPVTLTGTTIATGIPVSAPAGPAADRTDESLGSPPSVYLNVENIEGEANPGLLYGVYVNLPEDEPPDPDGPHFAGTMSFFGIESSTDDDEDREEAPHGLRHVFDITGLVAKLTELGRWDPEHLDVTFSAIGVEDEIARGLDVPPVRIGRVSLFMQ